MALNVTVKVDTTRLDNIIANVGNAKTDRFVIADGVEYGVVQELGLGTPAQQFLRPAFEAGIKGLADVIGQAIRNGNNPNDALRKTAFDIQGLAQMKAPVDTGALKNSIHVEVD